MGRSAGRSPAPLGGPSARIRSLNQGGGKPTLPLPSHRPRRPEGALTQISQLPGTKTFGGARKPPAAALRAGWRPLRGSFALPADRDTFAEFPGLFPAFPLALPRSVLRSPWRRLAHLGTPRSRSAHSTCRPRETRAKGPRETSHNSKSASGGGCGARMLAPSRRHLGARPAGGASAISRSKRRLHSAGANRTPWCG